MASPVTVPLAGPVPTPGPSNSVVAPSIISVTPTRAYPNAVAVILGLGFTGVVNLVFGNVTPDGVFVGLVATLNFARNGDTQITFIVPDTVNHPTSFLQVNCEFGSALITFDILVPVTWDTTGCNFITGRCPVLPFQGHANNTSVGVDIFDIKRLTAQTYSGQPGQGACVNPIFAQSTGKVYWEITWNSIQSQSLAGGPGLIDLSQVGKLQDFGANGTNGIILHPDGNWWVQGVEAILNPLQPQAAGDTIGFFVDFTQAGGPAVNIYYLGPSKSRISTASQVSTKGPWLPCVSFDTAGVADNYAVTANFGSASGGTGSFVIGSSFLNSIPGLFPGWPGAQG